MQVMAQFFHQSVNMGVHSGARTVVYSQKKHSGHIFRIREQPVNIPGGGGREMLTPSSEYFFSYQLDFEYFLFNTSC